MKATPRVMVTALRGDGGKTLVSVGLAAAWREDGRCVVPFKKGPDYIDAAWLGRAAGRACRNLDLYLMSPEVVQGSFITHASAHDVAIIEGNRGLYDGMDALGACSSAELAKCLKMPVILVIDASKSTRTIAAIVMGCRNFDPEVPICGVVLNRIAGKRHESVLRASIEQYTDVPVLGALPRLERSPFPERHLGLVPPQEHGSVDEAIQAAARAVRAHVDIAAIQRIAENAPILDVPNAAVSQVGVSGSSAKKVRIGVCQDAAFQFYYPENLEALQQAGAELVAISPLKDTQLPNVDALYIGGGFPETMAEALAANELFRKSLRNAAEDGLPIYAECGGTMFLGERLVLDGKDYPMAGVLPVVFGFGKKPRGHGYAALEVTQENPFFAVGDVFSGHEFHYSYVLEITKPHPVFAYHVKRGYGFDGEHDGMCYKNVLAAYIHLHALGVSQWADSLIQQAVRFSA